MVLFCCKDTKNINSSRIKGDFFLFLRAVILEWEKKIGGELQRGGSMPERKCRPDEDPGISLKRVVENHKMGRTYCCQRNSRKKAKGLMPQSGSTKTRRGLI